MHFAVRLYSWGPDDRELCYRSQSHLGCIGFNVKRSRKWRVPPRSGHPIRCERGVTHRISRPGIFFSLAARRLLHKCHIHLLGDHAAFALTKARLIPSSGLARTKSAPSKGRPQFWFLLPRFAPDCDGIVRSPSGGGSSWPEPLNEGNHPMSNKTPTEKKRSRAKLTHADLSQFTGDLERFYRPFNRKVIYTPGVKYLAEKAEAYWLMDDIASYYGSKQMIEAMNRDPRLRSLQFWRLDVAGNSAVLIAFADVGEEPFIRQEIQYTDFPLDYVEIWAGFDGQVWTLYLPSEH